MFAGEGLLSFQDQLLKLDNEQTIEQVAKKIENFGKLNVLDLRGNTLGVNAGERLADALRKHPELQRCIWSDIFTGRLKTEIPPILKSLCGAMIQANCHITELDLSDNAFGPIGAEGISEFLVSPAAYTLTTLRLNNNGLGSGGIQVANCLLECHENSKKEGKLFALKRFIAGRNRLEDPGAKALSRAFSELGTLEEIRLPQNGIRASGVSALACAFEKNPNLQIIDINDNTCTRSGAAEIAMILPDLQNLVELDLGDCLCRDEGVMSIIAGLDGERTKLKRVVLSGNEITANIMDKVAKFFKNSLKHVSVHLAFNNLGDAFHEIKNDYKTVSNLEFGDSDDDQGSISSDESDYEEQCADDGSMEDDDGNTSRETVIDTSLCKGDTGAELMNNIVDQFGTFKINKDRNNHVLSFLDQKLKLDTAENAEEIARKIENHGEMRVLELKGNTIGVKAGERLAKALETHPELERCLWSDMFTGRLKTEIPPILKSLGKSMIKAKCQIKELDLSDNAFGPIGAEGIEEFLESESCFTLEVLKLNNNGLGIGGKKIAESIYNCLTKSTLFGNERRLRLKIFIAGRNRLENACAIALAKTFERLETLEEIHMPQNGINKDGIKAIAKSLVYNKNLRVLNLNDNTATQLGAYGIAESLKYLPKLEILDLGDCLCRDGGCHAIIDSLDPNIHKNLKEVNLTGAEMGPQAAQIIIGKWKKFDGFNEKPILKIGTNNFGELFNEVRQTATKNISIGDSDDDCGSLSDDEEEYNSPESTDDEESGDKVINQIPHNYGDVLKHCEEMIDNLNVNYQCRVQEESTKLLLKLVEPLRISNMNELILAKVLAIAEELVKRVAAVKRNPIPTTTQMMNHCVAQCKTLGIKPEEDWGITVDAVTLGKLLRELLLRGHFTLEREMILNFFPSTKN